MPGEDSEEKRENGEGKRSRSQLHPVAQTVNAFFDGLGRVLVIVGVILLGLANIAACLGFLLAFLLPEAVAKFLGG